MLQTHDIQQPPNKEDKKSKRNIKSEKLFQYVFSLAALKHFRGKSRPTTTGNVDDKQEEDEGKRGKNEEIEILWRTFLQEFTLNGFRYVFQKGVIRSIIWFIILISAFAAVAVSARKSFIKFFNRPITTTVQVIYKDEIVFPAVTLCNFNFFPHYLINGTIGEKVSTHFCS